MRNLYAAHNVYLDEENVPADHIMVELEFTALLLDSYDKTDDCKLRLALREWIENHMSKWIPAFTEEIRLHADSDFYRTTAEILRSLLFEMQNDMKGVA
jgi:TorA maturation chaperone TorD